MSAVTTYQTGSNMHVHRKPLPQAGVNSRLQPLTRIAQDPNQQQQQQISQYSQQQPLPSTTTYSHNRASTASLSSFSQMAPPGQQYASNNPVSYQAHMNAFQPTAKRSLSNATSSSVSTSGAGSATVARRTSASSSTLQRTASSRSGGGQPSYVQLMRKQKATVWSDRTPYEDPRVAQQQRAAKMRAAMEVSGAHSSSARASTAGSSSLTGGIRSKVRHHGAPKAMMYAPNPHPAIGVPVRLSANEVDEDDDDRGDEGNYGYRNLHHRSGSGRSSNGSGARNSSVYGLQPPQQSSGTSHSSTPGSLTNQGQSPKQPSPASSQRRVESQDMGASEQAAASDSHGRVDYFSKAAGSTTDKQMSPGGNSGDSNSRENSFGDVGDLPHRTKPAASTEVDLAELRRRGSVDERTMTISGYSKLFVANPDLE